VRVPERQQPKAQAHSEEFRANDIDEKTCRSGKFWLILRVQREAEKLAAARSFYHEEPAGNSEAGDNRKPLHKALLGATCHRLIITFWLL
jgi:hypothetical protein